MDYCYLCPHKIQDQSVGIGDNHYSELYPYAWASIGWLWIFNRINLGCVSQKVFNRGHVLMIIGVKPYG